MIDLPDAVPMVTSGQPISEQAPMIPDVLVDDNVNIQVLERPPLAMIVVLSIAIWTLVVATNGLPRDECTSNALHGVKGASEIPTPRHCAGQLPRGLGTPVNWPSEST